MARPRNKRPNYVSIDVVRLGQIVMSKSNNDELAEWVRKASKDLLVGCVGDDVDKDVLAAYNDAFDAMVKTQERKRELHERKKNSHSSSTAVAPVNASKRNDQLIWGRFENVFLSQDEFNVLAADLGNINELHKAIDSFSASLADGKTQSQNHFATLTRWIAWRKSQEEKEQSRPHYESVSEHNARVLENGKRLIHEMFGKGNK